MSTAQFAAYADYYDLLNQGKDYAGEAAYVHALIQRLSPGATELLEFGCGTGGHARELRALGYRITGVDLSARMVELATARTPAGAGSGDLRFIEGDMRSYRSPQRFDAVVALFHVMSYQVATRDLAASIQTAAAHLAPGGVLVFDCWYGPGVLTEPPSERIRTFRGSGLEVTRVARPVHYPNEDRVDVHFDIEARRDGLVDRFEEVHSMRYLFAPEVFHLLQEASLAPVALERWLEGGEPGLDTWNACFVARK